MRELLAEKLALQKAFAEVTKRLDLLEKANASVLRAQRELELVKERGAQLQETLALKAKLAREKLDAKNAVALAALDQKLARMEGRKLDEAKATVEREAAKEREKRDSLLCDGDTVDAVLGSVFD